MKTLYERIGICVVLVLSQIVQRKVYLVFSFAEINIFYIFLALIIKYVKHADFPKLNLLFPVQFSKNKKKEWKILIMSGTSSQDFAQTTAVEAGCLKTSMLLLRGYKVRRGILSSPDMQELILLCVTQKETYIIKVIRLNQNTPMKYTAEDNALRKLISNFIKNKLLCKKNFLYKHQASLM